MGKVASMAVDREGRPFKQRLSTVRLKMLLKIAGEEEFVRLNSLMYTAGLAEHFGISEWDVAALRQYYGDLQPLRTVMIQKNQERAAKRAAKQSADHAVPVDALAARLYEEIAPRLGLLVEQKFNALLDQYTKGSTDA